MKDMRSASISLAPDGRVRVRLGLKRVEPESASASVRFEVSHWLRPEQFRQHKRLEVLA